MTFGTPTLRLFIAQGEHPKVIQERLGHASIKTTLTPTPLRRPRGGHCRAPERILARFSRGHRGRSANAAPSSFRPDERIPLRRKGILQWAQVDLNHRPHPYQGCALTGLSYGPCTGSQGNEVYRGFRGFWNLS
jgi:hypothetical protein